MVELKKSRKFQNVDSQSVKRLCTYILKQLKLGKCDLSVSLVNGNEITRLNKKYFNKDYTTDVISFPMEEHIKDGILLGDVVVCVPQAERSAVENRISFSEELSLYLIHGILHLIGERDISDSEAKQMSKKQERLLKSAREGGYLVAISRLS